jgi:hypothetical protein
MRQLIDVFDLLGLSAENLYDSVIAFAGGAESLAKISSDYYNITRTDAEKLVDAQDSLREQFSAIGREDVPQTVSALRSRVEMLQNTSLAEGELAENRQAQIVAIMALAPAVQAVEQAMISLGETLDEVADFFRPLFPEGEVAAPRLKGDKP